MRFGIREICDVVLKAKSAQKIGNKVFYKNEPVLYFDSLKTSTLEEATTTVYAQGGRGNARLIAWEGERTVTFTMEDALLSKEGFAILSGAGLVNAEEKSIIVHKTEITNKVQAVEGSHKNSPNDTLVNYKGFSVELKEKPYISRNSNSSSLGYRNYNNKEDFIYIMLLDENGEICSEPYIASESFFSKNEAKKNKIYFILEENIQTYQSDDTPRQNDLLKFYDGCSVLVDYYVEKTSGVYQIDITPDKFSGNFYLEASTLFRTTNGVDLPAEFIIPNCKIQSNFTFTMASSGDPSTFTFTMDAFPDYTRWDKSKKVFAAIQILEQGEIMSNFERLGTPHNYKSDEDYNPFLTYKKEQEQYLTDKPEEFLNDIFSSIGTDGKVYNNGLGYKKKTEKTNGEIVNGAALNRNGIEKEDNVTGYLITGFIPFESSQMIRVSGFNKEANSSSTSQGIYFYDENFAYLDTRVQFYVNNSSSDLPVSPEDWDYNQQNYEKTFNVANVKYIRVCFYNQKLSELAILVTDTPIEPSRSIEPDNEEENNDDASTRSILLDDTSNSSESDDNSIDELLAYLEEQEQEEEENR